MPARTHIVLSACGSAALNVIPIALCTVGERLPWTAIIAAGSKSILFNAAKDSTTPFMTASGKSLLPEVM